MASALSPSSDASDPIVASPFENLRQSRRSFLVRGVAKALRAVLDHKLHQYRSNSPPGSYTRAQGSGNDTGQSSTDSSRASSIGHRAPGKRSRNVNNDQPRDDEDGQNSDEDQNDRANKKGKKAASSTNRPRRRLKCPYYQRCPEEHSRAACRGEGFVDMGKLK